MLLHVFGRVSDTGSLHVSSGRPTVLSSSQAVNAENRVALLDLPALHLRERLDRGQATVLREGKRHGVECGGKRTHGVLLNGWDLDGNPPS